MKEYLKILLVIFLPLLASSCNSSETNRCLKDVCLARSKLSTFCFEIVKPLFEELEDQKLEKEKLETKLKTFEDVRLDSSKKDKMILELNSKIDSLKLDSSEKDRIILDINSKMDSLNKNLDKCEMSIPISSCLDKLTGVYNIEVPGMQPFQVPCDSNLDGLGWTVIQRRQDGSVDFNRNWEEYREGFGNFTHEFFIGLKKLHYMTKSQPYNLYIYLVDLDDTSRYAYYRGFLIGSEEEDFKILKLGEYSGNAGDSLEYHKDMKFSTKDRDNDADDTNCADHFKSGWWFNNCYKCNLNGVYSTDYEELEGIKWNDWSSKPLKFSQIMIRPSSKDDDFN